MLPRSLLVRALPVRASHIVRAATYRAAAAPGAGGARPRSFCTAQANQNQKKKKEGGGVPWGFIIFASVVGSIGAYFWRGHKNGKILKKLQNKMLDVQALSAEEVELARSENQLSRANFDLLRRLAKKRFPQGQASPTEFFAFCGQVLYPDLGGHMKAQFLFDRLAGRLEERNAEYDTRVLLTAVLNALESSVDDRIEELYKLFCSSKLPQEKESFMTQQQFSYAVDALILTDQLPLRALTREYKQYPYNTYRPSWGSFLATRAVEEVVQKRKKAKGKHWFRFYHDDATPPTLRDRVLGQQDIRERKHEYMEERAPIKAQLDALKNQVEGDPDTEARILQMKDELAQLRDDFDKAKAKVLAGYQYEIMQQLGAHLEWQDKLDELEVQQQKSTESIAKLRSEIPPVPREEIWSLEDFTDMIYSRAVCAWGECEFADKR